MRLLISMLLVSLSAFAAGRFDWGGETGRQVGIVIDRCHMTPKGVEVGFYSDMPPPYVIGVYPMDTAQMNPPRCPVKKMTVTQSPVFVRGNFFNKPVCVCVMSEPMIPSNLYEIVTSDLETGEQTTLSFGLDSIPESELDLPQFTKAGYPVKTHDTEDWGHWRGVHSDSDGSLFVKQFGENVRIPCTCPHYQNWRSELVLIPPPFKSMSVNTNGLRWCRSDNGIYYWQRDTNAVPRKINLGGF